MTGFYKKMWIGEEADEIIMVKYHVVKRHKGETVAVTTWNLFFSIRNSGARGKKRLCA